MTAKRPFQVAPKKIHRRQSTNETHERDYANSSLIFPKIPATM